MLLFINMMMIVFLFQYLRLSNVFKIKYNQPLGMNMEIHMETIISVGIFRIAIDVLNNTYELELMIRMCGFLTDSFSFTGILHRHSYFEYN